MLILRSSCFIKETTNIRHKIIDCVFTLGGGWKGGGQLKDKRVFGPSLFV